MKCEAVIPYQPTAWVADTPFLLWEIGQRLLIEHWLENLFRSNAELNIWLEAPDEALFTFVCDTFPLNRHVQVQVGAPKSPPEACVFFDANGNSIIRRGPRLTSYLPRQAATKTWFAIVKRWLAELHTTGTQVPELEKQIAPGVFVGHHCIISPDTKFIAPCWVGSGATIRGASIGPNVVIGEGAVVTRGATLTESYVLRHSVVGPDLQLNGIVVGPHRSLVIATGAHIQLKPGVAATTTLPATAEQPANEKL